MPCVFYARGRNPLCYFGVQYLSMECIFLFNLDMSQGVKAYHLAYLMINS